MKSVFKSESERIYNGWPQGFLNSLSSIKHTVSLAAGLAYSYFYVAKDTFLNTFANHSDDDYSESLSSNLEDLLAID